MAHNSRTAYTPSAIDVIQRLFRLIVADTKKTDLAIRCPGDRFFRIVGFGQFHLHVRLAGAEPDIADEKILHLNCVLPGHHHLQRTTGLQRAELDPPRAVGTVGAGDRLLGLPTQRDRDLFTRIGPSPHDQGEPPLQDRVIAIYLRQADIRLRHRGNTRHNQSDTKPASNSSHLSMFPFFAPAGFPLEFPSAGMAPCERCTDGFNCEFQSCQVSSSSATVSLCCSKRLSTRKHTSQGYRTRPCPAAAHRTIAILDESGSSRLLLPSARIWLHLRTLGPGFPFRCEIPG